MSTPQLRWKNGPRRACQLNPLSGRDVPLDQAAHDQRPDIDLGLHLAGLADDEQLVADDLAFELAVDANRTGKTEDPFELGPLPEEGADLAEVGARPFLVSFQHGTLRE